MNDIIKQIEELYVEGDEPSQEIKELCEQVYNKDCPWCHKGSTYEYNEAVEAICDCITNRFKK